MNYRASSLTVFQLLLIEREREREIDREREREARGKKARIKGQIILQNYGRG